LSGIARRYHALGAARELERLRSRAVATSDEGSESAARANVTAAGGDAFAPAPRPGALLGGLTLWLAVTVVASSLLAPIAFRVLEAMSPGSFPFDRVFRRVAMLVALVHLVAWLRRAGAQTWPAAGFTRAGWRSGAGWRAAAAGLLAVGALMAIELAAGTRGLNWELDGSSLAKALLGGVAVGLLEEGVCRGALVFPFGRLRGAALAACGLAISAVYSTGHFVRGRTKLAEVDWTSGFDLWGRVGAAIAAAPAAWVGLLVLGLVFDRLARRQGHVWGAAGLHAGAVAALQIASDTTDPSPAGSLFFTNGLHPAWPLTALLAVAWLALGRKR
jgi:hypothetical protein